jgi:hypothetical protein
MFAAIRCATVSNGLVTAVSYRGLASSGIGRCSCRTPPEMAKLGNSAPTLFGRGLCFCPQKKQCVLQCGFAVAAGRYLQREFGDSDVLAGAMFEFRQALDGRLRTGKALASLARVMAPVSCEVSQPVTSEALVKNKPPTFVEPHA